jgi:hypothetical protein
MKRVLISTITFAAIVPAMVWLAPAKVSLGAAAQAAGQNAPRGGAPAATAAAPAKAVAAQPTPRMADGHPDLSGVWWGGGDVGSAGFRGGGRGTATVPYNSLYQPWAAEKARTLSDKDDPTLKCIPVAFGTLNVSLYSVGAVGQIIATPKFVVMLQETFHGFQLIPTDGRPHREDVPPAYRGDSVGKWEGDTFVVDTTNYTDNTWMFAEGRVSIHSDALHIVERYRRPDFNTLEIEAKIEDPKVLTGPWNAPKATLTLAPFDMVMSLACTGVETQSLMDGAAKLKK